MEGILHFQWLGLDNKNSVKDYENSLKQIAITVHGLIYSGGLIIGRIFASEIWGAYFREGLFLEGLIGILRYSATTNKIKRNTLKIPTDRRQTIIFAYLQVWPRRPSSTPRP